MKHLNTINTQTVGILHNELQKHKIEDITNIYLVGSRLYGTHNNSSDYDFLVVTRNTQGKSINHPVVNATVFSMEKFQKALNDNKILVLEAYFSPKEFRIKEELSFSFEKDLDALRKNGYKTVTETLEIAKKNSRNYYICRNKLFHAYRVLDFMNQIIDEDRIISFSSSNELYYALLEEHDLYEKKIAELEALLKRQ